MSDRQLVHREQTGVCRRVHRSLELRARFIRSAMRVESHTELLDEAARHYSPFILSIFRDILPGSHVQFESSALVPQAPPTALPIGSLLNIGVIDVLSRAVDWPV